MSESEKPPVYKLPTGAPPHARTEISDDLYAEILRLYEDGRYAGALQAARKAGAGSLQNWKGTHARVLGSRLAGNLYGARLARYLIVSAVRESPSDPEAQLFYYYHYVDSHGPLAAWQRFRRMPMEEMPASTRCSFLALKGRVHAAFRDFETAGSLIEQAMEIAERERSWICVERAYIEGSHDDPAAALHWALKALELRPFFRPAVQHAAHLLYDARRDDEAIELLRTACDRLESPAVCYQLASIFGDLKQFDEALEYCRRGRELALLAEPGSERWQSAREADYLYGTSRLEEARARAAEAGGEFYKAFAQRLEEALADKKADAAEVRKQSRIRIDVPFVKQSHNTCGPASLAALCAFWGVQAPQEEIAATICYDGTFDHAERWWASRDNAIVREFRVTWDVTRDLIRRGIPFTLTTCEVLNAHLQVVCGFDELRNSILIRDPSWRYHQEYVWSRFIEHYEPTGPRGMLILPAEKAGLIDGIELPDAGFYDDLYILNRALFSHQREAAAKSLEQMKARDPEHWLTWNGVRSLAFYDGNALRQLEAVQKLRTRFTRDARLIYAELRCLNILGRRDQRLELLEREADAPGGDPAFIRELAVELSADGRESERCLKLLSRAARFMPADAGVLFQMANSYWGLRRFEEGYELFRLAACRAEANGAFADNFFLASRHLRKTNDALEFLRRRFERFGSKHAEPACTLSEAYNRLDRAGEALKLLEEALALRPADGDLMLFAAERFTQCGEQERGRELLQKAKNASSEARWRRAAAQLARNAGNDQEALTHWLALLENDPLAMDAHREIAQITYRTQGLEQVLARLTDACRRWPEHLGLLELHYGWLREAGDVQKELDQLENILQVNPAYGWARREYALRLAHAGRHEESIREAERAVELEPGQSYSYSVAAQVHEESGRIEDARALYRKAISLAIDNAYSVQRFVALASGGQNKREALAFVHAEIVRQPLFGQGLTAYYDVARQVLDPPEMEEQIQEALEARPDLWDAWYLAVRHRIALDQLEEGETLAQTLCERFPLVPGSWNMIGSIRLSRGNFDGASQAYRRAMTLNPHWSAVARQLADSLERGGNEKEALSVVTAAIARDPLDPYSHGRMAILQWKAGLRTEAIQSLERALTVEPGYPWAWDELRRLSEILGRKDEVARFCRKLTQERSGDARAWMELARSLSSPNDFEERLKALDQAISVAPRNIEAHDDKALFLANEGRLAEALTACEHPVWKGDIPLPLQGRKIWVRSLRGETKTSIEQMQELLKEHPYYEWGWRWLLEMLVQQERYDEAVQVVSRIAQLAPGDCTVFGWSADLKLRLKRRDEAKADLRRAISIEPSYGFAIFKLYRLLLDDREFPEAEQLLKSIDRTFRGAESASAHIRFALAKGDKNSAVEQTEAFLTLPNTEAHLIEEIREAYMDAALNSAFNHVLRKVASRDKGISGVITGYYSRRLVAQDRAIPSKLLKKWQQAGLPIEEALFWKLSWIDRQPQKQWYFNSIRKQFDAVLRSDTSLWGKVGYFFVENSKYQDAVEWLRDWQTRPRVEAWMLANLSISHVATGNLNEAGTVAKWALDNCQKDDGCRWHRTILALAEAKTGNMKGARMLLDHPDEKLSGIGYYFRVLAEALVNVAQAEKSVVQLEYRNARRQIAQAAWQASKKTRELRQLQTAIVRQIAEIAEVPLGVLDKAGLKVRTLLGLE